MLVQENTQMSFSKNQNVRLLVIGGGGGGGGDNGGEV